MISLLVILLSTKWIFAGISWVGDYAAQDKIAPELQPLLEEAKISKLLSHLSIQNEEPANVHGSSHPSFSNIAFQNQDFNFTTKMKQHAERQIMRNLKDNVYEHKTMRRIKNLIHESDVGRQVHFVVHFPGQLHKDYGLESPDRPIPKSDIFRGTEDFGQAAIEDWALDLEGICNEIDDSSSQKTSSKWIRLGPFRLEIHVPLSCFAVSLIFELVPTYHLPIIQISEI